MGVEQSASNTGRSALSILWIGGRAGPRAVVGAVEDRTFHAHARNLTSVVRPVPKQIEPFPLLRIYQTRGTKQLTRDTVNTRIRDKLIFIHERYYLLEYSRVACI
jgi:hypothetical protein